MKWFKETVQVTHIEVRSDRGNISRTRYGGIWWCLVSGTGVQVRIPMIIWSDHCIPLWLCHLFLLVCITEYVVPIYSPLFVQFRCRVFSETETVHPITSRNPGGKLTVGFQICHMNKEHANCCLDFKALRLASIYPTVKDTTCTHISKLS